MKIVAVMVARNESWVIRASVMALAEWCDELVLLDHASDDGTMAIAMMAAARADLPVKLIREPDPQWREMAHRQRTLEAARSLGATHIAVVDADEIVTAPVRKWIRSALGGLAPGELLDVPMVAPWRSLDRRRVDDCIWTRAAITVGFCDAPALFWRQQSDGYEHHSRPPAGHGRRISLQPGAGFGGVMHLQFADWPRLQAKHVLYQIREVARWPGRRDAESLRATYTQALDEQGLQMVPLPDFWWGPEKGFVRLGQEPWQAAEARRLAATLDPAALEGLELMGVVM